MAYFRKLISKIKELEDNFIVINSRIIEFWKSTDYEHLDFWLINKYFNVLTLYLVFLEKQKEELSKDTLWKNYSLGIKEKIESMEEYISVKKLVEFRIDWLISKITDILKKVFIIIDIKKENLSTLEIEEIFKSSSQMDDIKDLLKQFHIELELYKKVQKLLWINVDLDDKIEKEIEDIQSEEEILQTQRYFIERSRDYLENILEERNIRFNEIVKREDNIFKSISNIEAYNNLFYRIFKKEYVVWLDIEESNITLDYKKFKKFNTNIDLILDISDLCKNFNNNLILSKDYWLDKFVSIFSENILFLHENILNKTEFNLNELIRVIKKEIWVRKLKSLIFYLKSFSDFIDIYDKIMKINFSNIDSYYNSWFIEFFKTDIKGWKLINKLLEEYRIFIINKLSKLGIDISNIWNNKKVFLNLKKDLIKLHNWIVSSNNRISSFNYPGTFLYELKRSVKSNLKLEAKSLIVLWELNSYYNQAIEKAFKQKKDVYLAAQKNSYSSSSSRSSSSSYSSSNSSSSWSSSSSSWNSSYSSSWSSSW